MLNQPKDNNHINGENGKFKKIQKNIITSELAFGSNLIKIQFLHNQTILECRSKMKSLINGYQNASQENGTMFQCLEN